MAGKHREKPLAVSATEPQPPPTGDNGRHVWDLVIEDMKARDWVGAERYGTRLRAFNGRDPLIDAYQEALDLCVYLRQEIEQRREREETRRRSNAFGL